MSIALARARELGFETIACASTGNLANAVAAHAAAAGLESYVFVPSDLEEQKLLATGVYGTNLVAVRGNYDDVNRLCTELSAEHDWAFVNINMRPVLRRGVEDARVRDRRAARVRAAGPRRVPDRLGLAVHEDRARLRGVDRARAARRRAAHLQRRPGRGLLAGRDRVRGRASTSAARSSRTRSPSRWRSATRPTARTRSTWRGAPAARSTRSPTTRSARASSCSPGPRASSPRPPAASRSRCWPSSPSAATSIRRARRRLHHRRGPEDARLRPRDVRGVGDRADASTSFEHASERVGGRVSVEASITLRDRWQSPSRSRPSCGPRPTARRRRTSTAPPSARCSTRCTSATASCAAGSPRTAGCAGSSTSTSAARTSASSTGSRRPVSDGDEVTILPAVAGG